MEAEELMPGSGEQIFEQVQGQRAIVVVAMFGITLPDESDPVPGFRHCGKGLAPVLEALRVGLEIGGRAGDGLETSAEAVGQARERKLEIDGRRGIERRQEIW